MNSTDDIDNPGGSWCLCNQYQAEYHSLQTEAAKSMEISFSLMLLITPAFPAGTYQNACCEKCLPLFLLTARSIFLTLINLIMLNENTFNSQGTSCDQEYTVCIYCT